MRILPTFKKWWCRHDGPLHPRPSRMELPLALVGVAPSSLSTHFRVLKSIASRIFSGKAVIWFASM